MTMGPTNPKSIAHFCFAAVMVGSVGVVVPFSFSATTYLK